MIQNREFSILNEGINGMMSNIYGSGRLAYKTAMELIRAMIEYHPFVGDPPVAGIKQNKNFHLTGMIIENIVIAPLSSTVVSIELTVKDADSYHKELFVNEATVTAAEVMEKELDAILKENGF